MASLEGRQQMLERHEIVVRIIEANSKRLRLDNEINGLDIERRIAERDLNEGASAGSQATLEGLESKLAALRAESSKLDVERAWLEEQLTEFDGAAAGVPSPRIGRA
jgi:hypothetical protein